MDSSQDREDALRDEVCSEDSATAAGFDALSHAIVDLVSTTEHREVLGRILDLAGKAIPRADQGLLALNPAGGKNAAIKVSYGLASTDAGRSDWFSDLRDLASSGGDDFAAALPGGAHSCLLMPLSAGDRRVGFIALFSSLPDAFGVHDAELLRGFAAVAGLAVHESQLYAEIESLEVSDRLTGLLNRRGYLGLAEREFRRARRYHQPLVALLIDLDGFKSVNDQYGHAVGDRVLRGVARSLRHHLRAVDVIGRFGGEEFAVLLVETDMATGLRVANRLRRALAECVFENTPADLRVTASVGLATLSNGCTSLEQLLERAGKALRSERPGSRNAVRAWTPARYESEESGQQRPLATDPDF